jgi:hypothetical protein
MRSDPSGKFLYSTGASGKNCGGGNAIIGFKVNQTTGVLTTIPGLPLADPNPAGPVSGAMVVVP